MTRAGQKVATKASIAIEGARIQNYYTYQVCAFGKLSVDSMSTRWIVNSLGPIAPVEPAI